MRTGVEVEELVETMWEKEMDTVVEDLDIEQEMDEYADEEVADSVSEDEEDICQKEESEHNSHEGDGDLKEMLIKYLQTKPDTWQRDLAYEDMAPQIDKLIKYVGHKYFATYMANPQEKEEMLACGRAGVMSAINEYDPNKAMPSSYFFRPILHELQNHVSSFIHESSNYNHTMSKRIEATKAKLAEDGIMNPSIMTIAIEMGVRPSTIRKQLERPNNNNAANYEDRYNNSGKVDIASNEIDDLDCAEFSDYGDPYKSVIKSETTTNVQQALASLTDAQQACIRLKFGFEGRCEPSYAAIGAQLGLSVDMVKKNIQRGINVLRMNPRINAGRRANRASEIQHSLNYEPFAITPDKVGLSMMNTMDDLDNIDSLRLS